MYIIFFEGVYCCLYNNTFNFISHQSYTVPTPEIVLNTSDVYSDVGNSLVLSWQLMLFSGNLDNATVATFQLKKNGVVFCNNMSVPVINETKFTYTAIFYFDILKLSSAGEYTCTGIIDDAAASSFIIQSNKTVDSGYISIKSKWKLNVSIYISYILKLVYIYM